VPLAIVIKKTDRLGLVREEFTRSFIFLLNNNCWIHCYFKTRGVLAEMAAMSGSEAYTQQIIIWKTRN